MTARRAALIVVGLTGAAAVLRVPGLDTGLWYDEIVTLVDSVRRPLGELVTVYRDYNNHPLYSLLAHISIAGLGEHAWTLRLPAYVFGVAGIPILYWTAAIVTTQLEAALAALLLAVSYHDVWFSQNARGYTMLLFFTLLATGLLLKSMKRPTRPLAIAYGCTVALGVYTHLTMAFVVVVHAGLWGWRAWQSPSVEERRQQGGAALIALGVAGAGGALLYLPMVRQVYALFSVPQPAASTVVATPKWAVAEMLRGLQLGFGTIGLLAVALLVAFGGVSYLRRNLNAALLFVLPPVFGAMVLVGVGAAIRPRFFLSFAGFVLVFLVRGAMECGWFLQQRLRFQTGHPALAGTALLLMVSLISAGSLPYNYRYPKQDYEAALHYIERNRAPSEPVATAGLARLPYDWYYRRPWAAVEKASDFGPIRAAADRLRVRRLHGRHARRSDPAKLPTTTGLSCVT
jgi:mannosyltransferase